MSQPSESRRKFGDSYRGGLPACRLSFKSLQGRAYPWTAFFLTSAVYFLFFVIAFKCFQSLLDLTIWLYGDLTVRGLINHFQQPFVRWDLEPAVAAGVFAFYCLFRSVRELMSASDAGEESLVQDLGGVDFPASPQEMDRIKGDYIREKNRELADLVGLKTPKLYFQPDEPGINTFVTEIRSQPAIVITWGTVAYLTLAELEILILAQLIRLKTGRPRRETKAALLFWGFFSLRLFGLYLWRNPAATYCPRFLSGPVLLLGALGTSLAHPVQVILGRFDELAADRQVASHLVDRNIMAELLKKTGSVNRKNGRLRTPSAMDLSSLFWAPPAPFGIFNCHLPLERRVYNLDPDWDGHWPRLNPPPREMILGSLYF